MKKTKSKPENAPQEKDGGDCPLTPCSPSSDTPETDDLANEIYARGIRVSEIKMLQHARELERRLNALYEANVMAICILDGNAEVIDWRNKEESELLRKLCEHLEAQHGRIHPENAQSLATQPARKKPE